MDSSSDENQKKNDKEKPSPFCLPFPEVVDRNIPLVPDKRKFFPFDFGLGSALSVRKYHSSFSISQHMLDDYRHNVLLLIDLDRPETIPELLPESLPDLQIEAIDHVVKTIWILWSNDIPSIWSLIQEWCLNEYILVNTCRELLSHGLRNNLLVEETIFDQIAKWVASDSPQEQRVGINLFPVLQPEFLFEATETWHKSDQAKNDKALPRIIAHIFNVDPNRCMRILLEWTRKKDEHFDSVICDSINAIPINDSISADELNRLEKGFRSMAALAGGRNIGIKGCCSQRAKECRDLRSKALNTPPHSGPPGPEDPGHSRIWLNRTER